VYNTHEGTEPKIKGLRGKEYVHENFGGEKGVRKNHNERYVLGIGLSFTHD